MKQSTGMKVKELFLFALICSIFIFNSEVRAYEIDFHGYVESNIILRDTNGFESGFMDHLEAIQQRNTFKCDVDINIKYSIIGGINLDKVHLTYRGAFDTIFNLRSNEYDSIPNNRSGSRFNYGKEDIKYENDLREASFDLTYRGPLGSAFFRPGRQLVSWGEATAKNIVDVVNPSDMSFAISAFPDELKTPLWMGRLVYNIPPQPNFGLNFDFVVVPDIRPLQLGPLPASTDVSFDAPYIRNTKLAQIAASPLGQQFFNFFIPNGVYEDVPSGRTEYGGRVTADIFENISVSGVYYRGIEDNPCLEADLISGTGEIVHPWKKTYGGYFNAYISPPFDLVLKGEFGYSSDIPVERKFQMQHIDFSNPVRPRVYEITDQYSYMIGVDRNFWARWFSSSQVQTSFQWIRTHTKNHEEFMATNEDVDLVSAQILWFWWNGRITPMVFCVYDTQGTWMTNLHIPWTITRHWKAALDILGFWGNEYGPSYSQSDFSPLINTSCQTMLKLIYQW